MDQRLTDILLVEDDPGDAEMIIRALKKNGLSRNIVHVENGAEAVDFLFGTGTCEGQGIQQPRVVVLDLNMPKLNGLAVLKMIREDKRTQNIPVVVLTSSQEPSDIRSCYDAGVNSYIVKPVEFSEFSKTVSMISQYWLEFNLYE